MCIESHEYANETNDNDIPKPAQSLDTLVPRQNVLYGSVVEVGHRF